MAQDELKIPQRAHEQTHQAPCQYCYLRSHHLQDFLKALDHLTISLPNPNTLASPTSGVSQPGLHTHNVEPFFSPHLSQTISSLRAPLLTLHTPSPKKDAQFRPGEADPELTWGPPPPTIPLPSSNLPHHHHHPLHAPFTLPSAVSGKLGPLTWRPRAVSRAASRPELPKGRVGPGPGSPL